MLLGTTGKNQVTWIWEACKSMVMMWSAPATDSMLATSFAEIGARLWGIKHKCLHLKNISTRCKESEDELFFLFFPLQYLESRYEKLQNFRQTSLSILVLEFWNLVKHLGISKSVCTVCLIMLCIKAIKFGI